MLNISNVRYDDKRSTKNKSEKSNLDSEKNSNLLVNIDSTPSAKNFRDHGTYFSFHIVPRKKGNVRNTPNLVINH